MDAEKTVTGSKLQKQRRVEMGFWVQEMTAMAFRCSQIEGNHCFRRTLSSPSDMLTEHQDSRWKHDDSLRSGCAQFVLCRPTRDGRIHCFPSDNLPDA
ncbi:hypothetical protein KSP40_PGU011074 [Platanthera guangdongensis]|uniref:Uncharacterized protein n=1 Tax=Platanthera guangdongensis TaxID=2320717 RepID=A0ABR2LKP0_9ASPA